MFPLGLPLLLATDTAEVLRGSAIAVGTVVVLVLAVGVVAFVILFRRGGDRGIRGTAAQSQLESRAAGLLIALDDRVREADLELGFAIAQFGADAARDFATAVSDARGKLTEAFRLGQQRDDAPATADQRRRSLTLQITALCEKALSALEQFDNYFSERRTNEVAAATTERQLRLLALSIREQLTSTEEGLKAASARYSGEVLSAPQRDLAQAQTTLADTENALDAAAASISPTGVNAVTDTLHTAATSLHQAQRALSSIDEALARLSDAENAVLRRRASIVDDIAEARSRADSAPDPQSGARILTAIAANEQVLESTAPASGTLHDPFAQLNLVNEAAAELDNALATARNQQQRFEHARAAYQGTLVAARSQISVVRELIGQGGTSARARTRLAEAERQLMIAEAETDPVEALDAIRRSVTHARDADALARY
tara:strand:+ start:4796 stop:6094 length:1299 start_codon:yes stop_codon:yes gene_type:complete